MRTPALLRLAAVLLGAASLASFALPAAAADEGGSPQAGATQDVAWSMIPVITDIGEERTSFAYALEPGQTVSDAVLVRNSGASELTLAVSGAGGESTAAGTIDFDAAEASMASWIAPGRDEVTIEPGGLARVPFTVTVPEDALPGEHAGALLTVRQQAGETVSVDMRYATRVTVTVAGELTAGLELSAAALSVETGFWPWEPATARVGYDVANVGNTRLSGMQLIEVQGTELVSTPDAAGGLGTLTELLPEAAVTVDATVPGIRSWWPVFEATVTVAPSVLTTASGEVPVVEQARTTATVVAIAPGTIGLAAGALLIPVVIVVAVRRRRARR